MKTAVLFDLDGVLVSSKLAWFSLMQEVGIRFRGHPISWEEFDPTFGQETAADVATFGLSMEAEALDRYYAAHFKDHAHLVVVNENAAALLASLRDQGVGIAVVTNTVTPLAIEILSAVGLLAYPSIVLGPGDGRAGKPAPDLLLEALSALDVTPLNATMVGDSIFDQRAAHAAGVPFVGLGIDGDARIERLSELATLIHIRSPKQPVGAPQVLLLDVLDQREVTHVYELLFEARRLLGPGGQLEIRLPDYDTLLSAWNETLDPQYAAHFCTFAETDAAGRRQPGGYEGPPRVSMERLREFFWPGIAPLRVSLELRRLVLETETYFVPLRCSAWGREDIKKVLAEAGFELLRVETIEPGSLRYFAKPLGLCQSAALPLEVAAAHYPLFWSQYFRSIQKTPQPSTLQTDGYLLGALPLDLVERLESALSNAKTLSFHPADYDPTYVAFAGISASAVERLNLDHHFLDLDASAMETIHSALVVMEPAIKAALGSTFEVVNVRAFRTHQGASLKETNAWHTDEQHPACSRKLMLYVSAPGTDTGSTEIALSFGRRFLVAGPPGTWLLFKNRELWHRGVPPRRGERCIIEITLSFALEMSLRPVCAGQNAEFPIRCPVAPADNGGCS